MVQKKSWREKLEEKHPNHGKIVKILIPKPLDIDTLMRSIPMGRLSTDEQIKDKLAKDYQADKTCSKVTGIFIRIAAEAAEENLKNGKKLITPYWRVIKKDSNLNPKFPGGIEGQAGIKKDLYHESTKIRKHKKENLVSCLLPFVFS